MKHTLENMEKLYAAAHDDAELLAFISERLSSFVDYHRAIYESEMFSRLYSGKNLPLTEYQEKQTELEKGRTICHNVVLASVSSFNRIAEQYGIPLIYTGKVSEEHPYRREVADAVLGYVESIILERR